MAVDESGLYWWHSIRLPDGTVTPGEKSADVLEREWASMRLPTLAGKTLLDIGAWDGWFSFRAEAEGAARVVALDSYVWELDFTGTGRHWAVGALPGKRSFDRAHTALASAVEPLVADIVDDDLSELGSFDVTFFLGVLYHLRQPLRGLEQLRGLTGELAVIETEAIRVDGHEDVALIEFLEGAELNNDASNWHVPTEQALHAMCRAAGFDTVETIAVGTDEQTRGRRTYYRLTIHARPHAPSRRLNENGPPAADP